jgi:hypothetical protein
MWMTTAPTVTTTMMKMGRKTVPSLERPRATYACTLQIHASGCANVPVPHPEYPSLGGHSCA